MTIEAILSLTTLHVLMTETGGVANHRIRLRRDAVYTMI